MTEEDVFSLMIKADTIGDFLELWLTHDLLPPEEQKIFNQYYRSYKKYFGPYIKRNYSEQTRELVDLSLRFENSRVLEIGPGCGTEALWLALKGVSVTGIDIDESLLAAALARKELLERYLGRTLPCSFFKKSILEMDDSNKFDVIFMEQTFHHLEPREKVLNKIAGITNDQGYVVISEINFWNPLNQLFMFWHRGFKTIGEFESGEYKGHPLGMERLIPAFILARKFSKIGYRKISIRYFRILPNLKIADKLGWIDDISPIWFLPFFTHYNYIGKKYG